MIFNSAYFVIFLVVVLAVYWSLNRRSQNYFLLVASCFFYGFAHPWFISLILTISLANYFCAQKIVGDPRNKKIYMTVAAVVSLGMLSAFKYYGFFMENVNAIISLFTDSQGFRNAIKVMLPVGISFYTFQALSYTIDVYRGKMTPRKNLPEFLLFVSFFPQLVAGPIERADHLLPQIEKERRFDIAKMPDALFLLMWGFFKKIVIADNVAITCNKVFMLENPSFPILWAGVFAFSMQIYADFSAYTDIARGCAKMLGFDIVRNFDHPYVATSPTDFWRRWHISLSNWIRDYVYISLGGGRGGGVRVAWNLMLTFFLCGLWHGAAWNFVIWGLYHGALILLHRALRKILPTGVLNNGAFRMMKAPVMFILVMFGWLFFRETDLSYLIKFLALSPMDASDFDFRAAEYMALLTFIYSSPLWAHVVYSRLREGLLKNAGRDFWLALKTGFAVLMVIGMLQFHSGIISDFIYFQF